ncbi:MAG: hypothetical protein ACLSVD_02715 [Eggerthellaceae bacterium]
MLFTLTADELRAPKYHNPTRGFRPKRSFKERYFAAAERAKKAGLIRGARGERLLPAELCRAWEPSRRPAGCQSVENRTRLVCEIIRGVKER